MKSALVSALTGGILLLASQNLDAYPEYQLFSQTNSGRYVNCSMCHAHPDGPEGVKPGQIGSLTSVQLDALGHARAAFEPGKNVDSPILNDFGNRIVTEMGKRKVLELRAHPAKLVEFLDSTTDLDGDGIPDTEEYLDGTHPLESQHGSPTKLVLVNAKRQAFHIVILALATVAGLFGLNQLLRWFAGVADKWVEEAKK